MLTAMTCSPLQPPQQFAPQTQFAGQRVRSSPSSSRPKPHILQTTQTRLPSQTRPIQTKTLFTEQTLRPIQTRLRSKTRPVHTQTISTEWTSKKTLSPTQTKLPSKPRSTQTKTLSTEWSTWNPSKTQTRTTQTKSNSLYKRVRGWFTGKR